MAYTTINLIAAFRHRFLMHSTISNPVSLQQLKDVYTLLDTGAFNTMIDSAIVEGYGILLPITIPISIGGYRGEAQGYLLHKVVLGDFVMTRVFALAYPFKGWLMRHIVLGANVLNNWEFTVSKATNEIWLTENIPLDVPNKTHPYQNYFAKGKYIAIQQE